MTDVPIVGSGARGQAQLGVLPDKIVFQKRKPHKKVKAEWGACEEKQGMFLACQNKSQKAA